MYQNAPQSTQDRHKVVLTISVSEDYNGNSSYSATVVKSGGTGDVTIQSTANPLIWNLVGSRIGVGGTGTCNLSVLVVGNVGGAGSAATSVKVRVFADIDDNNIVGLTDKVELNKRLNGLPVGQPDRAFNLDGDAAVGLGDKVLMNKVLNGLPIN